MHRLYNVAANRDAITRYTFTAIVATMLFIAFGMLAEKAIEGSTVAFDKAVMITLHVTADPTTRIGPDWLKAAARSATALGRPTILGLLLLGTATILLVMKRYGMAAFVATVVFGGIFLSGALEATFIAPMRAAEGSPSQGLFNPVTTLTIVYLTIGTCLTRLTSERWLRVAYIAYAVFLVAVVGLSRLYAGLDQPSDVALGWVLGATWILTCQALGE